MDSKEADAYLETAEDQMKDAELALRGERCALCAFLSASSAENATSALLITLGAKPSRKHRNSLVMYRLVQSATPKVRSELVKIIECMKTLESHITKTRYPILKGGELLPPSKLYTRQIAEKALSQARRVVESVKGVVRCHKNRVNCAAYRTGAIQQESSPASHLTSLLGFISKMG